MKRILISVLVLALSGLLLQAPANAAVVFQDDFNDNDTVGWTFLGNDAGEWGATGGVMSSSTGAGSDQTYDGVISFARIDGASTTDHFRLSADVKVVNATGRGSDWGHVGLFWDSADVNNYTTSYLRTHSDHVTTFNRDPSFSGQTYLSTPGITNGVFYSMSVEVDYINQIYQLTLDGSTLTLTGSNFTTFIGNNGVNNGGGLGLIQWGEEVHYDNVVLEDLTQAVPLPGMPGLLLAGLLCLRATTRNQLTL